MSMSKTTLSGSQVPGFQDVGSGRRRRWPFVVGAAVLVLAVFVIVASRVSVADYALLPGDAQPVSHLISLPPGEAHRSNGRVLLTDVGVDNVSLFGLLEVKLAGGLLDPNTTIVSSEDLTYGLPVSQFDAEGTVDMEESELTAEAVALRQLGYEVPEEDVGVTVYVVDPGSPASRVLKVGDVVSAIDGVPTPNPQVLQSVLREHRPDEVVTLQVGSVTRPLPGRSVSLRLGKIVENHKVVPLIGIGDPNAPIAGMGTQPLYRLPFAVKIDSDQIGGPSAGLAWTLGIIDSLSGGGLTGGRTVAATGTIDPDGTVGAVGGVEQKTVAVERAGASVFLVPSQPAQELAAARAKATPGLKVIAVSSLHQALLDLQRLGGRLGRAAAGPPAGQGGHNVPYDWQQSPWS
jgi:PDZ domain-containing protein